MVVSAIGNEVTACDSLSRMGSLGWTEDLGDRKNSYHSCLPLQIHDDSFLETYTNLHSLTERLQCYLTGKVQLR